MAVHRQALLDADGGSEGDVAGWRALIARQLGALDVIPAVLFYQQRMSMASCQIWMVVKERSQWGLNAVPRHRRAAAAAPPGHSR